MEEEILQLMHFMNDKKKKEENLLNMNGKIVVDFEQNST